MSLSSSSSPLPGRSPEQLEGQWRELQAGLVVAIRWNHKLESCWKSVTSCFVGKTSIAASVRTANLVGSLKAETKAVACELCRVHLGCENCYTYLFSGVQTKDAQIMDFIREKRFHLAPQGGIGASSPGEMGSETGSGPDNRMFLPCQLFIVSGSEDYMNQNVTDCGSYPEPCVSLTWRNPRRRSSNIPDRKRLQRGKGSLRSITMSS